MTDFDRIIDRRGSDSEKWEVGDGELPMWVADMDFRAADPIIEAVQAKAASGVYGYTHIPDQWAASIASWWDRRHHWPVDPAWIGFCIGIVPAVSSLVRTFAPVGSPVVTLTPVYNCFFTSIINSDRELVTCDLTYDQGVYGIDWAGLEAQLVDPSTRLMLLCNPHNPTGTVWSRADLARIGQLSLKHDVVVVSDEIHCDLTRPSVDYTPYASVDDTCANTSVTLVSPTKAFNIAGLRTSAVIASNQALRDLALSGLNRDELNEPNFFAVAASIAAFDQGAAWLDQLRDYVWANHDLLRRHVSERLPMLRVVDSQATYLAWVDCSAITDDTTGLCDYLRATTGLFVNPGQLYGQAGRGFIRINLACPISVLEDGLARLTTGVRGWISSR
ncbi:MAG: pyridoxal phosphate-dependent aminotransferase [Propionibacteriaceae bacterium]|jgi:cystathionine beta-lyase|nr:pyridoxal phosphate-dependent aminotransferase [Propionibacteriaceae bacterium]